ncbi:MAG: hypothetical protein MUO77_12960 [Anaerolineales bacterium]|nr:hypothetical protein [Anaerolineales bacterium]
MLKFLEKPWPFISIALLVALVVSLIFYPSASSWLGIIMLISSLGMAIFFITQKHLQPYKQGQLTRVKFTRNLLLDILGLLLTIAAASYLGGRAGVWASNYGLWTGFAVGMILGFASALGVRQIAPTRPPPNPTMKILYADTKSESSDLGEVSEGRRGQA